MNVNYLIYDSSISSGEIKRATRLSKRYFAQTIKWVDNEKSRFSNDWHKAPGDIYLLLRKYNSGKVFTPEGPFDKEASAAALQGLLFTENTNFIQR